MWFYFWVTSLLSFLPYVRVDLPFPTGGRSRFCTETSRCLLWRAGGPLAPSRRHDRGEVHCQCPCHLGVGAEVKPSALEDKSIYHEAVKLAQFSSRDFSQELCKPYTFRCLSNVKLIFLKKGTGRSWCDSLENNSQVPVYFHLFPQEKEKLVKGIGKVSRLKSRKGSQITESCKQRCDENWWVRWTKGSGFSLCIVGGAGPPIRPLGGCGSEAGTWGLSGSW